MVSASCATLQALLSSTFPPNSAVTLKYQTNSKTLTVSILKQDPDTQMVKGNNNRNMLVLMGQYHKQSTSTTTKTLVLMGQYHSSKLCHKFKPNKNIQTRLTVSSLKQAPNTQTVKKNNSNNKNRTRFNGTIQNSVSIAF